MWFLGGLLGLIAGVTLGAAFGRGLDALFWGAILGAIAGGVLFAHLWGGGAGRPQRRLAPDWRAEADAKFDHIYRSLRHVHLRLEEIEKRLAIGALPPLPAEPAEPAEAPAAAEPAPVAPAEQPAPPAVAPPPEEPAPAPAATPAPEPAFARVRHASGESAVWRWLVGGNTLVRLGVVILFFGVAFLVKYAAENLYFPIELRLAGVAAGAIVMLAIGWRLRFSRPGYALAMQGGAVGVLYLTVFAAFRLYALLPPGLAFGLLLGIAVASTALAIRQDAMSLAMLAAAGGFLAPVLASTGRGDHVMLFGYYLALNLGILAVAWHKAWRPLNLLGFAFTFAIGALWGARFYRPEHFATTEPFLVAFFLIYAGIAVLYALRRALEVKSYVDGTLVFGTPLIAFGLQGALVRGIEYGLALSALALAAFYLVAASALWSRRAEGLRLLVESFLGLGVVFGTLAIPLALDGRWTSAAWALEGAAIVWVGARQGRRLAQWFGVALQFAAGVAFLAGQDGVRAAVPLANSAYLGCLFLTVAGLFCARRLARTAGEPSAAFGAATAVLANLLLGWGVLWWVAGGLHEIDLFVASRYELNATLGFAAATAVIASLLATRLDWRAAVVPALALAPAMVLLGAATLLEARHPLARYGWLAWPFAYGALAWTLRRHEDRVAGRLARALHVASLWLLVALACWEVAWWIDRAVEGAGVWPLVAWALVPALALGALARSGDGAPWPVGKHRETYAVAGGLPIAGYLLGWLVTANALSDGDPAPLPYAPLVNPLDLAMLAVLMLLVFWYLAVRARGPLAWLPAGGAAAVLGAAAFVWLNGMLLRTLHHWAEIPYRLDPMLRSTLVQTAFSVFWTVLALAVMVLATRRGLRALWFVGAALLGVVVVKLFVVDLSQIAGVERIVSFIAVGVLLLAIGYFSPVPPRRPRAGA